MPKTHLIGYAYASSPAACALYRARSGCFYSQADGPMLAHDTYAEALAAVHGCGTVPARWSMDHPENARFLPSPV